MGEVGVLLGLLLVLWIPPPPAAAADPACAWGGEVSTDAVNALFPENRAAYWAFVFTTRPGLHIRLQGAFPDARLMSLSVYKGEGGAFSVNGVDFTLTDFELTPDPGGTNPWRNQGRHPRHLHRLPGLVAVAVRPERAAARPCRHSLRHPGAGWSSASTCPRAATGPRFPSHPSPSWTRRRPRYPTAG